MEHHPLRLITQTKEPQMKKTDTVPAPTDKKITELDELQGRIDETTAMLYEAVAVIRNKTGERESLKQSQEIFIQDYKDHHPGVDFSTSKINISGYFDASRLDASQREQYEEIHSRLASVDKELFDAKERQTALQDLETSLLSSMAGLNANYATECILYIQKNQNEAERKVFTISKAIEVQQKIIEQNKSASQPVISEATLKREEMLAEIALGTIEKSELANIDDQLRVAADTAEQSTEKMNEAVTIARQTITGLQRKLETAQRELETVKFVRVAAEKRFLLAEAEKAGQAYAEAASVLTANYKRLLALETILSNKKLPSIEAGDFRRISIPLFSLICHKDLGEREFSAIENAARFTDLDMDMQSEFDRFASAGINL